MQLTIHRGAKEIGGSCVELAHEGCRLLVDLGIPLVKPGGGEFDIGDHASADGPELVARGVLPDVGGLYKWEAPEITGVLVSHGHQDHYGFLDFIHADIPVYLSAGTASLIEITAMFSNRGRPTGRVERFEWPGRFKVGAFDITPHLVDHSCFGAFAFDIEAGGKRVIYSGDFRDHGHVGKATDMMLDRVPPGADVLLLEGTMMGRKSEHVMTEQELADEARAICSVPGRPVLVYQSGQNVSRAVSFFKAALATDRTFVLDVYSAHVLTQLGNLPGGDSLPYPGNPRYRNIRVWYPARITDRLFKDGRQDIPYSQVQFKIRKEEIAANPGAFLVFVRPGMEIDLRRMGDLTSGNLIYSLWEGYRKSDRTRRFVEAAEKLGLDVRSLHTSGHATLETLQKSVTAIKPKHIIPIHTFFPDQYRSVFGATVLELKDGVPFQV